MCVKEIAKSGNGYKREASKINSRQLPTVVIDVQLLIPRNLDFFNPETCERNNIKDLNDREKSYFGRDLTDIHFQLCQKYIQRQHGNKIKKH